MDCYHSCVVLVPVVSSTMAGHCIVYSAYCITMQYLCVVVLRPQNLYLYFFLIGGESARALGVLGVDG